MVLELTLATLIAASDARIVAEVILGEDPTAPTAIAWVIKNRAEKSGKPIHEVIVPSQFHGFKPGKKKWSDEQIERATLSALKVLTGQRSDPTGGAVYFHAVGTWTPPWAPHPKEWKQFGKHYFYR